MKAMERGALVKRSRGLAWLTVAWNSLEGLVGITSGLAAGSVALVGFGVDSYVEVFAALVILWRLSKEAHSQPISERAEQRAVKLIAGTFVVLAVGIAIDSARKLLTGERPHESMVGIALTIVSLIVMPLLSRAKRRVGEQLNSRAVQADATETMICVWLSAIVLAGLLLNAALGWWWADPLAGFGIVYVAGREGIEHWRSDELDDCCS